MSDENVLFAVNMVAASLSDDALKQLAAVALAELSGAPLAWEEVTLAATRDLCEGRDGRAVLTPLARAVLGVISRLARTAA
ncbi:hypothetical protein CCR94_16440 [Rhodoblastus sphagnicola]|uniref:Uncharacterized protein n=1 Tax=Rhodoblastus sphagnicola TaxID=333368 RepID=A0A2S6N2Y9_9HYPH|nr:hypothetical protein [Rhodoblastus sphagnicola]MBB4199086.1 hypothetical protein [Rhodoblastus sphagnicola]PPQ28978.1 hypothetical protein CCR94_16440 [Rhodoblastus sphagnicola]